MLSAHFNEGERKWGGFEHSTRLDAMRISPFPSTQVIILHLKMERGREREE